MYEFIFYKIKELKLNVDGLINLDSLRILYADINMEKSDAGIKSIDNINREIIDPAGYEYNC